MRRPVRSYQAIAIAAVVISATKALAVRLKPALPSRPFEELVSHAVINLLALFLIEIHFPTNALRANNNEFQEAGTDEIKIVRQIVTDDFIDDEREQLELSKDSEPTDQLGRKLVDNQLLSGTNRSTLKIITIDFDPIPRSTVRKPSNV
jgi:hypothetical protein